MTYLPLGSQQWDHLNNPNLGFMNFFSEEISRLESKYPRILPNLRQGSVIFVGSDYSGQHDSAQYESLSFLFADLERCGVWEQQRQQIRRQFLSDGRRLSYKNLGDRKRQLALFPFLNAANFIPGLIVTILIDKQIESLFMEKGRLRMSHLGMEEYLHWDEAIFEKLLRVIHIVSFFIAGLSRPDQDLLWITDEDAIVADEQRLREFVNLFSRVSSHYLKHNLEHLRIGTTKSDTGKRDVEDLVAIPDLVAGALSRLLTEYYGIGMIPTVGLVTPAPQTLPPKAKTILAWFMNNSQPLKRLVYLIEKDKNSTKLVLKHLEFSFL